MALADCVIQDERRLCTDLQLGSLLFYGALNFKMILLNKCVWLLSSRKHQPTQTSHVSSEVVERGRTDMCALCKKFTFMTNSVWLSALVRSKLWLSSVLRSAHSHLLPCSDFHMFRYPSDAHRGDQDCSREATDSKMRLVMKLAA